MAYSALYTQDEIDELLAWFDSHADSLPAMLRIDKATVVSNVAFTVGKLKEIARLECGKPAFKGEIELLFRIRRRLEEGNQE